MDPLIKKVILERVVRYEKDFNRFECIICDTKLSGQPSVKDHLGSKQHRENGARYAIENVSTCPPSILSLLPNSTRDAAKAGEISVTVSKEILCHVCGSSSTGVVSLDDHLRSSNHRKKREARDSQVTPAVTSPAQTPHPTFKSHDVQQAIDEEIVSCASANDLQCNLCKSRFNGEESLKQHLESKKHREEGTKFAVASISSAPKSLIKKLPVAVKEAARACLVTVTDTHYKCNICQVYLSGVLQLNDHLLGEDHIKKNSMKAIISETSKLVIAGHPETQPSFHTGTTVPSSSGATPKNPQPILSQQPNLEIERALAEKIIIETDNKMEPYCCNVCDKKFNSGGTLLDHLRSKRHIDKEKISKENRVSSPPAVIPGEPSSNPSQRPNSRKRYSVISDVRGHVYIFNYTFKGTPKIRRGAEYDSTKLKETFYKMGYEVFIHEDLTAEETRKELKQIQRKPELNGIDSFITCFLSHGKDAYTFFANDEEEMDLHSLRRMFTNRKCPYLRGKPKIFFVNYCRGDQMQKNYIDFDDIEAPEDIVTIHAATEGIVAKRCRSTGTIFVTSLCKVLKEHAKTMDLRELYHELKEEMKQNDGTLPMWEDYVFKTFYFNPL